MKISVVIPTKNRVKDLKLCIKSLINQTYPIHELIIVDGSKDGETEKLISKLKGKVKFEIFYIKQTKGGLATARNIGNGLASGDIVFNLEDDLVLHSDYVKEVVTIFAHDKNGEIGGVGGKAEKEEKRKTERLLDFLYTFFGIFFLRDSLRRGSVLISGHPARLPNKLSYVEWLFNAAYRKKVLDEFKYDKMLEAVSPFAYYDDFDFSYSVSRKYKLVLNPRARYTHRTSFTSHWHVESSQTNSIKIQNHYYLVNKHNFSKIAFWWSTFGLLLAHAILSLLKTKENYSAFYGLIKGIKRILITDVKYR